MVFREFCMQRPWIDPGEPSTSPSTLNRFRWKAMLYIEHDQQHIVYRGLGKRGETNTAQCNQLLLLKFHSVLLVKSHFTGKDTMR